MKTIKRICAFACSLVLCTNYLTVNYIISAESNPEVTTSSEIAENSETTSNSNYGNVIVGWKDWLIGNNEYANIELGSGTVGTKGSAIVVAAKLMCQARVIGNYDFNIPLYANWIQENNYFDGDTISDWNTILNYAPEGNTAPGTLTLEKEYMFAVDFSTNEEMMKLIIEAKEAGKGVIAKIDKFSYVLAGDVNSTKDDVEVIPTKSTDNTLFSQYKNKGIERLYVFNSSNKIESSASKSDNPLDGAERNSNESSKNFYRISNYTQTQKEHLALIKNKYMTQKDISVFKWNMILSQFTIPYVNTIQDTANSSKWNAIKNNISSLNFENTAGLEKEFVDKINEHTDYLKSKAANLSEILEVFQNDSYYTSVFTSGDKVATVNDLLYGDVLYLKDNMALNLATDNNTEETTVSTDITEVLAGGTTNITTTEETSVTSISSETEESSTETNTVENSALQGTTYFVKLNEYYDMLNKSKDEIYQDILENSFVSEIALPCYINTDSTFMYNTLFINNAMRYMEGEPDTKSVSSFLSQYLDKPLTLDMYGNLCIDEEGRKVVVYPAYANPLYTSNTLSDEDLVGCVYDNYAEQITNTINVDVNRKSYLLHYVDSDKVLVTNKQAQEKIVSPVVDEDTALGYYGTKDKGTFQITDLKNKDGIATKDLWINRNEYYNTNRKENLISGFIDSTGLYLGNLTLLSMLNDIALEYDNADPNTWYYSMRTPKSEYIKQEPSTGDESTETTTVVTGSGETNSTETSETSEVKTQSVPSSCNWRGYAELERILPTVLYGNTPTPNSYDLNGIGLSDGSMFIVNGNDSLSQNAYSPFVEEHYAYNATDTHFSSYNRSIIGSFADKHSRTHEVVYPFIPFMDNVKGIFTNGSSGYNYSMLQLSKPNSYGSMLRTKGCVSSLEDHNSTGTYNLENLWFSTFVDASRYNVYLTLNTSLSPYESIRNSSLPNSPTYNYNSNEISKNTYISTDAFAYTSLPLNIFTVDLCEGWNLTDNKITNVRGGLQSSNDGLVKHIFKNQTNDPNTCNMNGTKYIVKHSYVKDDFTDYTTDDILFIATLWDEYYINQSPNTRKFDTKSITTGELYSDKDTVLTPYSILSDNNINKIYYTRITNNSMNLEIKDIVRNNSVESSSTRATTKVYNCIYNHPLLMISVYKNGYGANLDRWVSELKDKGSEARYMMDLISQVVKYPITGISNLTVGICQFIHSNLSNSTVGTFMNFSLFTDWFLFNDIFKYYIIIQSLIVTFTVLRYLIHRTLTKKKKGLLNCGRIIAVGFVPIFMLALTGNLFRVTASGLLSPATSDIVVTSLECEENPVPKELYGSDDDILIDDLYFKENAKMRIKFLADSTGNTIPVNVYDLYHSITLDGTDNQFSGERNYNIWYDSSKFIPVNYNRYDSTIFYYFYDYFRYQYLGYCTKNNLVDYSSFNTEEISNLEEYKSMVTTAEESYMKARGNFAKMYNDSDYVYACDYHVQDICGLSRLFNVSAFETGEVFSNYDNDFSFTYWQEVMHATEDIITPDTTVALPTPLLYLSDGAMWDEYKRYLIANKNKSGTKLGDYWFMPNNIPQYSGRIPNRTYASYGMLKNHTDSKDARLNKFETRLNKVNTNTYKNISRILEKYSDDTISDNILIFMSALYATFEFNKEFTTKNICTGIDNGSISADMLFKSMFSKDYVQLTSDDNIMFVIYKEYGLFNAVLFSISEIAFILSTLLMSAIYLILFISCMVSTFCQTNVRFVKIMLMVLENIAVIYLFEVCALGSILVLRGMLVTANNNVAVAAVLIMFLAISIASDIWSFKIFKGMLKGLKKFGGEAVNDVVNNFILTLKTSNIYSTASDIANNTSQLVSNYVPAKVKDNFSIKSIRENIEKSRRKRNIEESEDE